MVLKRVTSTTNGAQFSWVQRVRHVPSVVPSVKSASVNLMRSVRRPGRAPPDDAAAASASPPPPVAVGLTTLRTAPLGAAFALPLGVPDPLDVFAGSVPLLAPALGLPVANDGEPTLAAGFELLLTAFVSTMRVEPDI